MGKESELRDGIVKMKNYLEFNLGMTDSSDVQQAIQRAFCSEESAKIIDELFAVKETV